MNESEKLLSAFSRDIFYKEILYTDLHYVPEGENSEVELADLIINLGDILLAIQLKERNPGDNSGVVATEEKWLTKKAKRAKEQVKFTIDQIRSGKVTELKNDSGQCVLIDRNVDIMPLIVFKNESIGNYTHVLRKHNDEGLDVNCISFSDFEEICKAIVSPIEIIDYLYWREETYLKSGEADMFIFLDSDESVSITNNKSREALPLQYLHQKYGIDVAQEGNRYVLEFSAYLSVLSEHVVEESEKNAYYETLLFLAHLDRNEIKAFVERVKLAAECNKNGKYEVCGSLRNVAKGRVILFCSWDRYIDTEYLLERVRGTGMQPKEMLQVMVYFVNKTDFRIDMLLWKTTEE